MKISKLVILLTIYLVIASEVMALEQGFYCELKAMNKTRDVMVAADRIFSFQRIDKITVESWKGHKFSRINEGNQPRYFSRAELIKYLNNEKNRDILVVQLNAGFDFKNKKLFAKVKRYVQKFGYKRVLILGGHFAGIHVLYDSLEEK